MQVSSQHYKVMFFEASRHVQQRKPSRTHKTEVDRTHSSLLSSPKPAFFFDFFLFIWAQEVLGFSFVCCWRNLASNSLPALSYTMLTFAQQQVHTSSSRGGPEGGGGGGAPKGADGLATALTQVCCDNVLL